MSQEECARLRESVPYVKVHRYNPKHVDPTLNGYGDNGKRKVWSSCGSTYCTCSADALLVHCACPSLREWNESTLLVRYGRLYWVAKMPFVFFHVEYCVNNSRNVHTWSLENPHETSITNFQRRFSVNVWCGVLGNRLLGPIVFDNNLKGNTYEDFCGMSYQVCWKTSR